MWRVAYCHPYPLWDNRVGWLSLTLGLARLSIASCACKHAGTLGPICRATQVEARVLRECGPVPARNAVWKKWIAALEAEEAAASSAPADGAPFKVALLCSSGLDGPPP